MAILTPREQEARRATNPLFNDNALKLGTFCTNVSHGSVATTAEGSLELTWRNTLAIAQDSDRAGIEAIDFFRPRATRRKDQDWHSKAAGAPFAQHVESGHLR